MVLQMTFLFYRVSSDRHDHCDGLSFRCTVNWRNLCGRPVSILVGAYVGLCSIQRLGVFLLLQGWDNNPSQGYPRPSIKFLYTRME